MSVSIFFCYAHEDEALLNKLKTHLRPLQRQGLIDICYDRDISAGTKWEEEINKHLNEAQIILLLVSPDFMDSDYCYGKEMKQALERDQRGEARVIPIIVRPVYWQGVLGKLQGLPTDAKAVVDRYWHTLDEALYDVAEGIRTVVEQLGQVRLAEQARVAAQERLAEEERVRQAEEERARQAEEAKRRQAEEQARRSEEEERSHQTEEEQRQDNLLGAQTDVQTYIDRGKQALAQGQGREAAGGGEAQHPVALPSSISQPPGTTLCIYRGHTDAVYSVAWSPDGKCIASASEDKTLQVWDAATGNRQFTDPAPEGGFLNSVRSIAWSPDGKYIAFGRYYTVRVLDAATGNRKSYYRHDSDVHSVAWSPDGNDIASSCGLAAIEVWDAATGNRKLTYSGHLGLVYRVAWSPDGKYIASASQDRTLQVWDAATGNRKLTYRGHTDFLRSVVWSPDGRRIASSSDDGTVQVWQAI